MRKYHNDENNTPRKQPQGFAVHEGFCLFTQVLHPSFTNTTYCIDEGPTQPSPFLEFFKSQISPGVHVLITIHRFEKYL